MKKLQMNQMENLQGGKDQYDYCTILGRWVLDPTGYQGNINDVYCYYVLYCMD